MFNDLIRWSEREFRHLPWRRDRKLYTTLVSEIMLQQTTVGTVLNHYERFLKEFPTLDALASSTEEKLTTAWKGLGYYRRARNLLKACKYFQTEWNSDIPLDYEELIKAPGIGDYTANALLAIGANKNALALDANLERVLSRLNNIQMEKGPKLLKYLQQKFKAGEIASDIGVFGGRAYNEALMDLGRVYCKANRADCLICPLNDNCLAFKVGDPLSIPKRSHKKTKKFYELKLLRVIVEVDDKILGYVKDEAHWLAGQTELPTFIIESEDATLKQYPSLATEVRWQDLPLLKTTITKYKIQNYVYQCSVEDFKQLAKGKEHYFALSEAQREHLSTASLKSLNTFKKSQEER